MSQTKSDTIRILLVDDHPVVREGLRAVLENATRVELVGEAGSGAEALASVAECRPDVVLMDINLPGMSGIETTRELKKAHPKIAVVLLTVYENESYLAQAVAAGASGYLTKGAPQELIVLAMQAAFHGGAVCQREMLERILQRQSGAGDAKGRLSNREIEVIRLLAKGHGNRAIAAELHLAEVTVKKYVQSLVAKLGASDRTQAALIAMRSGLIE